MPCEHESTIIGSTFWKHRVSDDGPVVAYTIDLTLVCTYCAERFRFATDMVLSDDRLSVKLSVAPGSSRFERDETNVPGQWQCPVCMFHLSSNFLSASTGAVAPNTDLQAEACPNGCGPLAKLTWRELGESLARQLEQTSKRLFALERAWPEGYAMPDSEI